MGVAYWVEHMAKDQNKAKDEWRERMLDEEPKKFMEQVVGAKKGQDTTFQLFGWPCRGCVIREVGGCSSILITVLTTPTHSPLLRLYLGLYTNNNNNLPYPPYRYTL